MRWKLALALCLAFLLLGCNGKTTKKTMENETVAIHQYGYGLYAKVTTPIKEVISGQKGLSFVLVLINNGDETAILKKIDFGGSTVALTVEPSSKLENGNIPILPNNQYVNPVRFSVSPGLIGGQEVYLFPIVCYRYKSWAQARVWITTDYSVYTQKANIKPDIIQSRSPIIIRVNPLGGGTYLLSGSDKTFTGHITIEIIPDISAKAGKGWPVEDCSKKENKTIRSMNITIFFPSGVNVTIENGNITFTNLTNCYIDSEGNIVNNKGVTSMTVGVKADYIAYQYSIGFNPIYMNLKIESNRPINLEEITIRVDADYDFYEMMDGATARFYVKKMPT